MSANTTYNIRINKRIKHEADTLYKNMGMTLSSAINLFLTQSVIQGRLPLSEVISEPVYVDTVLRDVTETRQAIDNGTAKVYETPDELFASWDDE
ncbi:MAG: type II toxin-antitoxin system RelB/DinJ family antitoxin [Clostridiales bacterium]|jgi:DNA-damage-inducible protein J|nr:type II toxin-antitoxin system RelB/DinJ family antitoxin [Clostridiales bacterium]